MGVKSSQLLESLDLEELDGKVLAAIVEDVKRLEEFASAPLPVVVCDTVDQVESFNWAISYLHHAGIDRISRFPLDEGPDNPTGSHEPLKWHNGHEFYAVISDKDNSVRSTHSGRGQADAAARSCGFPCSVIRLSPPRGNECPVEIVARFEPENCHWGILELQSYRWLVSTDVWSIRIGDSVRRFPTKTTAESFIASHKWEFDVVPWAFPARRDDKQES